MASKQQVSDAAWKASKTANSPALHREAADLHNKAAKAYLVGVPDGGRTPRSTVDHRARALEHLRIADGMERNSKAKPESPIKAFARSTK